MYAIRSYYVADLVAVLDDKSDKEIAIAGNNSEKAVAKFLKQYKAQNEELLNAMTLDALRQIHSDESEKIMYYI